jgi:hypothetical protein
VNVFGFWFLVFALTSKRFLQRWRFEERFFDSGTKPFRGSGKRLKMTHIAMHV